MSEIARAIPQRQFLTQHIHALSGNSHLAAIARDGGARAAVAARMGASCRWAQTCLPWLQGRDLERLQRMLAYFLLEQP